MAGVRDGARAHPRNEPDAADVGVPARLRAGAGKGRAACGRPPHPVAARARPCAAPDGAAGAGEQGPPVVLARERPRDDARQRRRQAAVPRRSHEEALLHRPCRRCAGSPPSLARPPPPAPPRRTPTTTPPPFPIIGCHVRTCLRLLQVSAILIRPHPFLPVIVSSILSRGRAQAGCATTRSTSTSRASRSNAVRAGGSARPARR
jgi:hypothetical protein